MKVSDILVEAIESVKKKKTKKVTLTAKQQEKKAALNAEGKRYHKPKRKASSGSVKPTVTKVDQKETMDTDDNENAEICIAMDKAYDILNDIEDKIVTMSTTVKVIGTAGNYYKLTFIGEIDADDMDDEADDIRRYNGVIRKVRALFTKYEDAIIWVYEPVAPSNNPGLVPGLHSTVTITVRPAFRK